MGHYAITCPKKKKKGKGQHVAATADMERFSSRFDQEFALMVEQLTGGDSSLLWYIDSGAS